MAFDHEDVRRVDDFDVAGTGGGDGVDVPQLISELARRVTTMDLEVGVWLVSARAWMGTRTLASG